MKPIINPGTSESMGRKTGPRLTPFILNLGEYISPTVIKYAPKTNGKNEYGEASPSASLNASHIANMYKQG